MKKIFYEKRGKRYIPISEYNSEWVDSFPNGATLVICEPGVRSRKFNIDPNYAAMIAAGRVAGDVISREISRASDLRPKNIPITTGQKEAWDKLVEEFGESARLLEWPSAMEVSEKAVAAMAEQANKLLEKPEIRKAFEQFLLVCELYK